VASNRVSPTPAAPGWSSPKLRGKTFVLARFSRYERPDIAKFIQAERGKVLPDVTAAVDFLVVGHYTAGPSPAEQKAERLNLKGATIRILDEKDFAQLFLPGREEALAMLAAGEKGLRRWNALCGAYWIKGQVDLRGVDFRGANLAEANFFRAALDGSDFRRATLSKAFFDELNGVIFDGARLQGARLESLTDCSLKDVDLHRGAVMGLTRTVLAGARLTDADLHSFSDCDLRGADLSQSRLHPGKFERCDLTGASLRDVRGWQLEAVGSIFRRADLRGATLRDERFPGIDFAEADLGGADLTRSDLTGAVLAGARLGKADLTDARLTKADLRGADFRETNLAGASLAGARIDGADFTGANLSGTSLRGLDRTKAKGLEAARPVKKAGPHLRRLEEVASQCRRFETFAALDLTDGSVELRIVVREGWQKVWTDTRVGGTLHRGVAGSLGEGLLELTRKWARGTLRFDSVTVKSVKAPLPGPELKELTLAAWCEGLGIAPPAAEKVRAQRATRRDEAQAARERLLADLRGGWKGVERWNKRLLSERQQAGHFRKVDLSGARLAGADLRRLDFAGANFRGASLTGANLVRGTFRDADLERASLSRACLNDASFRRARLRGARLTGASAWATQFHEADFEGASLARVILSHTKFRGASLRGADLRQTQFLWVDLRGADLTSADLAGAKFEQATYDEHTRFPQGFTPPAGLVWAGQGNPPGPAAKAGAPGPAAPLDFAQLVERLGKATDTARIGKALRMLKAERFQLFAEVAEGGLVGVVKSQTDPDLVYSCRLTAEGEFGCCTQNLYPCGGLQGRPCKHLLVLLLGLARTGRLDAAAADQWVQASRGRRPVIDRDVLSATFLRYKGAQAGELDWRPTETVPEDFYAL
jgi:uncharacterized protein YjbI with pentapeptide repeats